MATEATNRDPAGIENELKTFLDELPKYSESIEDPNVVLSIADESIDLARNVLEGREAGSPSLPDKLSMAMIKQYLRKIQKIRDDIRRGILEDAVPVPVPSSTETSDVSHSPLPLPVASSTSSANTTNASKGIAAKNNYDHRWNAKFGELQTFKEVHGHCDVPEKYKANKSLGLWVKKQRAYYNKKKDGRNSSMTSERIKALESIGFRWRMHAPHFVPPKVSWEDRFDELKQYKEEHGNCNVPACHPDNSSLGNWVQRQRKEYKLYVRGEPSSMTRSRALALKAIGFEFDGIKARYGK